ncbi:hypothetical protein ACJ73_03579 [Blastomyces percursus]|uniref:Uncharacterized protein n=1 Tax=Blastomyces percursus TaxID=1658174 RepID=A0A1J9QXV0_9EURO|nr:hypothetical protein ACJ73_03579 [Blastomyces percursus]
MLIGRHCGIATKDLDEKVNPPVSTQRNEEDEKKDNNDKSGGKDLRQMLRFLLSLDDLNLPRKNLHVENAVDLFLLVKRTLFAPDQPQRDEMSAPKEDTSDDKGASADSADSADSPPMNCAPMTPATLAAAARLPCRIITPMPMPGSPRAPFFDGKDMTLFVNWIEMLRALHYVDLSLLKNYCSMDLQRYMEQLVTHCGIWDGMKKQLLADFWYEDSYQQTYNSSYLQALSSKKVHSSQRDILAYCLQFFGIAMQLIRKDELPESLACVWFLRGLPEVVCEEAYCAAGFNKISQANWELSRICDVVSQSQKSKDELARILTLNAAPASTAVPVMSAVPSAARPVSTRPVSDSPVMNGPVSAAAPEATVPEAAVPEAVTPEADIRSQRDVLKINLMDVMTLTVAEVQRRGAAKAAAVPRIIPTLRISLARSSGFDRSNCWGCGDSSHNTPQCSKINILLDQGKIYRDYYGRYFVGSAINHGPRIRFHRFEPYLASIKRALSAPSVSPTGPCMPSAFSGVARRVSSAVSPQVPSPAIKLMDAPECP